MNKRTEMLLMILLSISLLALSLCTYILVTQERFQLKSLLITCFEVVKGVQEHMHINLQGVIGAFVIATIIISSFFAILQFINFLISNYRLNTNVGSSAGDYKSKLNKLLRKHRIPRDVIRIIEGNKLTAYTFGIFKPKIVISNLLLQKLTSKQLEAIILHESFHIKNRHTLWLIAIRTISSFFFFIPIIKYLYRQLKTEFEMKADMYVESVQKTNTYLRQAIILNLEYEKNNFVYFSSSPLEKRVEYLVNKKYSLEHIGFWELSLSIASFILMIGIVSNGPEQVFAKFTDEENLVCESVSDCISTRCMENNSSKHDAFTIFVPASYQPSYSR